jgi:copper transport protein
MRLSVRMAVALGSVVVPGLAAVLLSGIADAQEMDHHTSHSINVSVSPHELAGGIAHGMTQGAVVFLAGLVTFVALVWLPSTRVEDTDQEKAVGLLCRWMWLLVGLLVVAGLVDLSLYAMRASGEPLNLELLQEALFDTRVGQLWILRLALGILTTTTATYAARQLRRPGYWWGAAIVVSALLLMTLTQQSHAAAEGGFFPIATDWLHLMAASVWMGGLLAFPILLIGPLRTMPSETRAKLFGRVVPRFSKMATLAVMTLVLTGLAAALLHVPSLSAMISTSYGHALSIKLLFLIFLLGLGAKNFRLRGREPFDSLVRYELALAAAIFVATGFLTSLPPADAAQPTADGNQASSIDQGLRQPPMSPLP